MNIIKEPMEDTERSPFSGKRPVFLHTLENDNGMKISLSELGAAVTKVLVPDRDGTLENVVLGFDDAHDYRVHKDLCLGATIGRTAGRIAGGQFTLNDKVYQLTQNSGKNNLHGGLEFSTAVWDSEDVLTGDTATVIFSYKSPRGSHGFPGTVFAKVYYTLSNDDTVQIRFQAAADEDTIVSLTNHTYFNLSGNLKHDILDHSMKADVCDFFEVDDESLPTGKAVPVECTPFDFTRGRMLRSGITTTYPQNVLVGNGYDHPLRFEPNGEHTVTLSDNESGRSVSIHSDFPGFGLYTGNFLGEGYNLCGVPAKDHLGVAIEMQEPPDAIHHDNFPSPILRAGDIYRHEIQWSFHTESQH